MFILIAAHLANKLAETDDNLYLRSDMTRKGKCAVGRHVTPSKRVRSWHSALGISDLSV